MAHQSRDYMQYLDGRYGFSPANSQEEMNAAQVISDALREHDLNTQVEEFSAPLWGKRLYFIPMLLLFVGVFLVIFPGPARIVGLLIALVSTGFLVAGRLGYDVLSGLGPKAASQNVIAVHRAVGLAEGERPGRPVVVVAHYDSGREDLLSRRGLSSWRSRLVRITLYSVPVTMVLTLILMIPAIPFLARLLLWIVALIASAPTLLWGINNLTLLFGSYAEGSVDNKSGVAAMLSVADKVVYGESYHPRKEAMENGTLEALQRRQQQSRAEAERAAYEQEGQYYEGQPTEGVQYADEAYDAGGQPVQEEPYEAPAPDDQPYQPQFSGETVSMPAPYDDYVDDQPQYDNEPAAEPARDERDAIDLPDEQTQDAAMTDEPAESVPSDQEPAVEPLRDERDDEPEVVEPVEQQPSEPMPVPAAGAAVRHGEEVLRRLSILPQSCEIIYDLQPQEAFPTDTMPEDPKWGSSEYVPLTDTSRSVIFDVTDPSMPVTVVNDDAPAYDNVPERMDGSDQRAAVLRNAGQSVRNDGYNAPNDGVDIRQFDVIDANASTVMEPVVNSTAPRQENKVTKFFNNLFHRNQANSATSDAEPRREAPADTRSGSDDEWGFDEDSFGFEDKGWKGGATRNSNLRVVDGEADSEPVEREDVVDQQGVAEPQDAVNAQDAAVPQDQEVAEVEQTDPAPESTDSNSAGSDTVDYDYEGQSPYEDNGEADDYASTDEAFVSQRTSSMELSLPRFDDIPARNGAALEHVDRIFDEESSRITTRRVEGNVQQQVASVPAADYDEPAYADRNYEPQGRAEGRAMTDDAAFPTIGDERVMNESDFFAHDLGPEVDFELREAITSMGRADLLRHDIWFVAVGASELDRAGMNDFVQRHRKELRGAFVINLSSVGAGDLTVITEEGIQPHRRADRRLVRTITTAAERLHIPLGRASMWWNDTDAMPAMRSSMRGATIMGCDPEAVPACSHSQEDTSYNVRRYQIADVAEVVAEVIRQA